MPPFTRARVAITPAVQVVPVADEYIVPRYAVPLHVGHVRSLILGSLIARERGIPFHVRLDTTIAGPNLADCVMDVTNCLNTLKIPFDYIYAAGGEGPSYSRLADAVGVDVAEKIRRVMAIGGLDNHGQVTTVLDDLLDWAPSLIVRGMEFKRMDAEYCGKSSVSGIVGHVRSEEMIAELLGVEKHECSLPLILLGPKKMGKSAQSVGWRTVTMVEPEAVHRFMVATALCPEAPFTAWDQKFSEGAMSMLPYVWSWQDWAKVVRMS